jgi:hypothetical protein
MTRPALCTPYPLGAGSAFWGFVRALLAVSFRLSSAADVRALLDAAIFVAGDLEDGPADAAPLVAARARLDGAPRLADRVEVAREVRGYTLGFLDARARALVVPALRPGGIGPEVERVGARIACDELVRLAGHVRQPSVDARRAFVRGVIPLGSAA